MVRAHEGLPERNDLRAARLLSGEPPLHVQVMKGRLLFLLSVATAACGDLKPAGMSDAAASETGAADGGSVLPDRAGPGPHGSLPSGYCCSSDSECRYRHCVDVGGAKTCLDECTNAA